MHALIHYSWQSVDEKDGATLDCCAAVTKPVSLQQYCLRCRHFTSAQQWTSSAAADRDLQVKAQVKYEQCGMKIWIA